jgi:hypothetical protein
MNLMTWMTAIMTDEEIKVCPDRCSQTIQPMCLYWKNHVYGVPCEPTVKANQCPRGYHVRIY